MRRRATWLAAEAALAIGAVGILFVLACGRPREAERLGAMIEVLAAVGGGVAVILAIAVIVLVRALVSGVASERASFASEVIAGKAQIEAERGQWLAEKEK